MLEQAITEKDYPNASAAAHELKGISGNMGVTPCYAAICTLVQSLRAGDYRNIEVEFVGVKQEFTRL